MQSKQRHSGFTLIESVIVITVMGLAMITIVSFLSPQIARSGDPHYNNRASALGQSVMTMILSRGFDHHSDAQGSLTRCSSIDDGAAKCSDIDGNTRSLGIDADSGETDDNPIAYDDVDDFIGCWTPGATGGCKDLDKLLDDSNGTYKNFRLDVAVEYAVATDPSLKRVDIDISASNQQTISFTAYRGNY